jgi:Xaa-Pro aminopeptidase
MSNTDFEVQLLDLLENPMTSESFAMNSKADTSGSRTTTAPTQSISVASLVNRERATHVMRRVALDGIVVMSPLNVYYLTGGIPLLSRFTQIGMTAAVIPSDPKKSIAYIGSGFEYYISLASSGLAEGVEPYFVAGSFGDPDPLASPVFASIGNNRFDPREQQRRAAVETAAPFYAGMAPALSKALLERALDGKALGVDTSDAKALVETASPTAALRTADDLMLHIRLVKTPPEMALMRKASVINVEASKITTRATREEGSIAGVRQRFLAEVSRRGNVPVYAGVDQIVGELTDGAFRDGQACMLDFVSHHGFYQGDYGRTVFFGEPDALTRRAAAVGVAGWEEVRSRLRPGLKFSEIHDIGMATVNKHQSGFTFAFAPHSVGLQHRDQPFLSIEGKPHDLVLEKGMVLSVDCPCLNSGINGTIHFEDLMVITDTGAEPLHEVDEYITIV